ncbi:putative ubiquitinyl hydrolase 1 [Helianthus debilis subsp. tardiflorus]
MIFLLRFDCILLLEGLYMSEFCLCRAGVPIEVMGLMLGEFVDEYTVRVVDVFVMPQSGTGVSVEAVDHIFIINRKSLNKVGINLTQLKLALNKPKMSKTPKNGILYYVPCLIKPSPSIKCLGFGLQPPGSRLSLCTLGAPWAFDIICIICRLL